MSKISYIWLKLSVPESPLRGQEVSGPALHPEVGGGWACGGKLINSNAEPEFCGSLPSSPSCSLLLLDSIEIPSPGP